MRDCDLRKKPVLLITLLLMMKSGVVVSVSLRCRPYQRIMSHRSRIGLCRSLLPIHDISFRKHQTILLSTKSSSVPDEDSMKPPDKLRRILIDDKLRDLGIDAQLLHSATQKVMLDPTSGYDGKFGRSAIKTYRSFLYPKSDHNNNNNNNNTAPENDQRQQLAAMAFRTAQQIDFLLKRHESHQEEWVRHHDSGDMERKTFPMILLLDNLRSAFNVGSIFRTADATGCEQVITTGITPHPNGNGAEKVSKSALGAEIIVPSHHFATTMEAIAFLRENYPDYKLIGLETTDRSSSYTDMKYNKNDGVVLVFGNEVTGLDTRIMPLLDGLMEIPMFGSKNSLNVSNCASVVCYEIVRQWNC